MPVFDKLHCYKKSKVWTAWNSVALVINTASPHVKYLAKLFPNDAIQPHINKFLFPVLLFYLYFLFLSSPHTDCFNI